MVTEGFCYIFKDIPFNIAHLNFAFEYYRIAKFMPLVIREQQVPPNQIRNARIFYAVLLVFNLFFPVLEGVTVIWYNEILIRTGVKPETPLVTALALGAKYGNAMV